MAMFHRSPSHGKFTKLITFFLRGCHLAAKAFDLLSSLGITLSQNWVLNAVDTVASGAMTRMLKMLEHSLFFVGTDNINIGYQVQEQTLNNQSFFASGFATTIYAISNPVTPRIDAGAFRQRRTEGRTHPLKLTDILSFEDDSSQAFTSHARHTVLRVLLNSPEFVMTTYPDRKSPDLARPPPVFRVPSGKDHRTLQFVLPTQHQEVASLDGNKKALQWILKYAFLGEGPSQVDKEARKTFALNNVLPLVGDQLTDQRMRSTGQQHAGEFNSFERLDFLSSHFGWFHAGMAVVNSFHKQFYGDDRKSDFGLAHIIKILERKHLHTTSTQGTFYHSFQQLIRHVFEALVRTLFLKVGKVSSLAELRMRPAVELVQIAQQIISGYASIQAVRTHERLPTKEQDLLMRNSMLMTKDLLDWIVLQDAMKLGDTGLMKASLPRLLFRFLGNGNSNYAHEMLEALQGFVHEWSEGLQQVLHFMLISSKLTVIIREFTMCYSWLVNLRGADDSHMPVDENQEHNIRDIKAS
jgi:hypothetical protein